MAGYSTPQLEVFKVDGSGVQDQSTDLSILRSLGLVSRSTTDRGAAVSFSPCGKLVACLGAGKAVELFK